MNSWIPIMMLAVTGFLIGGTISFASQRNTALTAMLGVATVLAVAATLFWWR